MNVRLLSVVSTLVLGVAAGMAWAEEINWDISYSGSYVDTPIDLNFDGTTANAYTLGAKGTGGASTITGVYETVIVGPSDNCPAPLQEFQVLVSTYVQRVPNGDLLFTRSAPGAYGCVDPVTGVGQGVVQYYVIGGTGKYEGATGSLVDNSTFVFLLQAPDPLNPLPFGALFGSTTGIVYTAED